MSLTVREPFGAYSTGDRIEDPATVAEIRASEYAEHVIPTADPDPPPKPTRAPKPDTAA